MSAPYFGYPNHYDIKPFFPDFWDYDQSQKIPKPSTIIYLVCQTMYKWCYDYIMPRHFYRVNFPKAAQDDDRGLHNAFVSITHKIGLSKFFSFVPPAFDRDVWRAQHQPKSGGDKKDYDHTHNPHSNT